MIRNSHPVVRPLALAALAAIALPLTALHADTVVNGSTVTVTPGGRVTQTGFRTAVVSATATNGDVALARSAMMAANVALSRRSGFLVIPPNEVAAGFGKIALHDVMDARDYMELGKKLKATRVLAITVSPGDTSDAAAASTALAELYDTSTGGLVGRGEGTFTATQEALAADTAAQKTVPSNNGTSAQALPNRALSGAVYRAIAELSRPATFRGVVVSLPGAYLSRLSLGARSGLRNGARIEYLSDGVPIGYGTVTDVGFGESVATIAPEANVTNIGVNTEFRTISNPMADRAGKSAAEQDEAEFRRFETQFGIAAAVAGIIYYATK